jgi:hypothetical protein
MFDQLATGGRPFHTAVPTEIGVRSVLVSFSVRTIVRLVVGREIVHGETVMTFDKIDALFGLLDSLRRQSVLNSGRTWDDPILNDSNVNLLQGLRSASRRENTTRRQHPGESRHKNKVGRLFIYASAARTQRRPAFHLVQDLFS